MPIGEIYLIHNKENFDDPVIIGRAFTRAYYTAKFIDRLAMIVLVKINIAWYFTRITIFLSAGGQTVKLRQGE